MDVNIILDSQPNQEKVKIFYGVFQCQKYRHWNHRKMHDVYKGKDYMKNFVST